MRKVFNECRSSDRLLLMLTLIPIAVLCFEDLCFKVILRAKHGKSWLVNDLASI